MRLVKINDVILNLDKIVLIKGELSSNDATEVYVKVYVENGDYILLGRCESQEDYQELMNILYKEFSEQFIGDVVSIDDEEKELWE